MALSEQEVKYNAYIDAVRNRCKDDLFYFANSILGYKELSETTHRPITDALQAPTKRKLIVCPRGTFKSSLCVEAYTVWSLIKNVNERIMVDSELWSNSVNFIRTIKAHFESDNMRMIFGDSAGPVWNTDEIIIKQRTQSLKESSACAGAVLTSRVGQHYTKIICDDLNSNKNSGTPEARQKVIDHYRYLLSILEPDGELIIVGTRYSSGDLIGFILENELQLSSDGKDAPRYARIRIQAKDSLQP